MDKRKINITAFVICLLLGVLFIVFCKQTFATAKVEGSSMLPLLENGEVIIINKLKQNYNRGDIVVFETNGHYAVKRIIGLPGETVSVINDKIHIDGNEIIDYTDEIAGSWGRLQNGLHLAEDEYVVLGDNRDNSKDSTEYGAIKDECIIGKTVDSKEISKLAIVIMLLHIIAFLDICKSMYI